MDEWNRFPNEEEPTAPAEQPAEQPTEQPNEQPTTSPSPYASYGWQQSPYMQQPQPPRPPKKRGGAAIGIICGICATVLVVLSVMLGIAYRGGFDDLDDVFDDVLPQTTTTTTRGDGPTLDINGLDEDAEGLTTREIVSRNLDSTVLLTMYTTQLGGSNLPFGQNGFEQEVQAGSASGIILSKDGYIITNWHCVINEETNEQFGRIDVKLYDGTVYENAQVIGADSSTDLAVIKVDAKDLKPAEFGDSTTMQLGDRVVALGNAGGLGWSATQGILSGLARDVYEDTGYAIKCFQVDAAINPGNSGGPLFNAAGQVIAVNSAKIVASGYEGLGFAIPINEAKVIVDQLISQGYVGGRVSLGITGQSYSDMYYQGFLIYTIEEGSGLRQTEARKGDLITAVGDVKVTDYATLRAALAKYKVGDTVTLTLLRSSNRQVQELKVKTVLSEATQ